MDSFSTYESEVRYYSRHFDEIFHRAKNELIYSKDGREYLDFLAGAGALNYGHNHDFIKQRLLDYMSQDGLAHGLDMKTKAKQSFIDTFVTTILEPRKLDYKIQFCGSTGTNAVEAALKLARKVTKRNNVFAFMGGFHGMTLGSLGVSSNRSSRAGAGVPLNDVTFFPFLDGSFGIDTLDYIEQVLEDGHSGIEKPAAVIFETIQAEGGVNPISNNCLQGLANLCNKHNILLICDDIQVGCGRTGPFFSFERANIVPDLVVLSKSISGYGLPMSLLLMKRDLDIWNPGEHNGTFRGNQLAFVASEAALHLREELNLEHLVVENESFIKEFLESEIYPLDNRIQVRGLGMIWGIDLSGLNNRELPQKIIEKCFQRGLIIENAGRNGSVIKILPPLTISREKLETGCRIIKQAITEVLAFSPKEKAVHR